MKEEAENKQGLAGFKWDEASDDPNEFFGQKVATEETTLTEEEKEQIKKEALEKKDGDKDEESTEANEEDNSTEESKEGKGEEGEKSKEDKDKTEEEVKFFEEEKTEGEEGTANEGTTEGEEDEFFKNLAVGLKEQGIFTSVEIPEGNISEEGFVELQEKEIEARIDETFAGFFQEMDEDGKAFLKFKKEGGSTKEFFDVLKSTTKLPEGDMEDEDYQKKVVRHFSTAVDDMDEEEIADRIEWLEENGKLKKYAEKYDVKLKDIDKKEKELLVKKAEQASKTEEANQKKFRDELQNTLKNVETIKDIPITENDKKELLSFITKPTVKVNKNKYLTGFQQKLQEMSTDYESLLLLAKLIKSDFDLSAIETKAQTKQVKKLRKTLERTGKTNKPTASKGSSRKELSDYF